MCQALGQGHGVAVVVTQLLSLVVSTEKHCVPLITNAGPAAAQALMSDVLDPCHRAFCPLLLFLRRLPVNPG